MLKETLIAVGLSEEEAVIYLALLEHGALSPASIAKLTPIKRTYVYKICDGLKEKGLISTLQKGRSKAYAPLSPDYLLTLAERKKQEAEENKNGIERLLSSLKEKYKAVDEKPIVQVYEGLEGLKKVYRDILEEKDDILLLRSFYDDKRPDLDTLITQQIGSQIKEGIHVRTITPLEDQTKEIFLKHDELHLVKRHIIHSTKFQLPSQVIIYKEKVAIISLKKAIISTLIDNKDISDTFRMLFEFMWERTEVEHEEIVAQWN